MRVSGGMCEPARETGVLVIRTEETELVRRKVLDIVESSRGV